MGEKRVLGRFFQLTSSCALFLLALWSSARANTNSATEEPPGPLSLINNATAPSNILIQSSRVNNSKKYKFSSDSQLGWGLYSPECPMAFQKMGAVCYFYGYFPLNWFRASEFCHSLGRSVALAVVRDKEQNHHIKTWLTINGNRNTGVWIGGSENGHRGRWAWFPTGNLIKYKDWGPSQPSGGDQHCLYMVGGILGYQWADFHCEFEMNFLCQYEVNDDRPW